MMLVCGKILQLKWVFLHIVKFSFRSWSRKIALFQDLRQLSPAVQLEHGLPAWRIYQIQTGRIGDFRPVILNQQIFFRTNCPDEVQVVVPVAFKESSHFTGKGTLSFQGAEKTSPF